MSSGAPLNPFLGPQPYRAPDRERFFGREEATRKLTNRILAHPCVTLFGPSGAGKSSVMQAGVIPVLEEAHGFRTVRIDGWLVGEPPLQRLVEVMHSALELGPPPTRGEPLAALDAAVELAVLRSDRPILVYLDQLEQVLLPGRDAEQTSVFFKGLDALARKPVQGLQVVLALREDYLGRFRDRVTGKRELLEQGFRLGPLTVGDMVKVVGRLAAEGVPAQQWDEEELRPLMRQMRVDGQEAKDEAEVQAAFAQIVCRDLWEERGMGGVIELTDAEPRVHRYLEMSLHGLGPHKAAARQLLEDHLVAGDGSRRLMTEQEARSVLPPSVADEVLTRLEAAAVLHAEEHQGSRYFELGHDWLARKVFELKKERLERLARRRVATFAVGAVLAVVVLAGLFFWALRQGSLAQQAQLNAQAQATRARDLALMAGARELQARNRAELAAKLLLQVQQPEQMRDWVQSAHDSLKAGFIEATFRSSRPLSTASFSPDGQWVVTPLEDGSARVWRADGTGTPVALTGHEDSVRSAEFSPDGQRVVTASRDGTARVWRADGTGAPVVLTGHERFVESARFSPDGQRVVTASFDSTARVWRADGTGAPVVLMGHEHVVLSAEFSPDGQRVVTASMDGTARVWRADGTGAPVVLTGHEGLVKSAEFSPDGQRVVTVSSDGTARVWRADGTGAPVVLKGHEHAVISAEFSPDGQRVVTASSDGTARVWRADGMGMPVVLKGHVGLVMSAEFSPDGLRVVTASSDGTARMWWADGMGTPLVLTGHEGSVESAEFSPDGLRVVTASSDRTARVLRAYGMGAPVALMGHEGLVLSAEFSPDGQQVVTASRDGTARVWRADGTGTPVVLTGHKGLVKSAEFSPDGQWVVTASEDGTARVWRADGTGTPVVLTANEDPVRSAAFSPDGQRVVTVSSEGTARVWRADGTGAPVVLTGHEGSVMSAAFSPDGQRVVTASEDRTARVWRADGTGTPVVLTGHVGSVNSAAFSPDGQRVVTAAKDWLALVWPLAVSELQSRLRESNSDCLLPSMRKTYLDESEEQAQRAYESCELSYGRKPLRASATMP
jgi:WD40 repeat protein